MSDCVYSCRHPVWGGAGACVKIIDGGDVNGSMGEEPSCLCEDGFVSRDFSGDASCVLKGIQLAIFLAATAVHLASSMVLAGHATRHWKLPAAVRTARRANIRLRLSVSTSLATGWMALVCSFGAARIWTGYLLHSRTLPVLVMTCPPVAAPSCMFGLELWVDSLPSQVLAADSLEARLKHLAENCSLFVWSAAVGTPCLAATNGSMIAFFGVMAAWSFSDATVALSSLSTGSFIAFVGVRISRVIGRAEAQAQPNSKGFYRTARRNLWTQVAALCGACAAVATIATVKQLLPEARRVPVIPVMLYMLTTSSAFVMAVHFSTPKIPVSRAASPVASGPSVTREYVKEQGTGGWMGGSVRGTLKGVVTSLKPRERLSLLTVGEARVAP